MFYLGRGILAGMKRWLYILIPILVLLAVLAYAAHAAAPAHQAATPKTTIPKATTFNKSAYSTTDPTSIWVVVNKQHPLNPKTYVPSDLVTPNVPVREPGDPTMQVRAVTATALEQMFAAAKSQGLNLQLSSGYRSYDYQNSTYNGYVQAQGQAAADAASARPGYSEHQTGLAADIEPVSRQCELDQCFANLPEGKWLAANAYLYGFIIRYTQADQSITGYEYEPWHVRYVGVALATELDKEGVTTLEQFFDITGGETYAQ